MYAGHPEPRGQRGDVGYRRVAGFFRHRPRRHPSRDRRAGHRLRTGRSRRPTGEWLSRRGKLVYDLKCVACHGPTGQEGPNDRLVGREPRDGFPFGETRGIRKTVGNYWPYATTLFDYVNRAMPMTFPGSLTANEIYAVAAYILFLNEIIPEDAVMNAETLPAVVMPARDRFVPDNRVGGPEVR